MTITKTHTIEPEDITAVELECKACNSKTVRPLKNQTQVPLRCGNCSALLVREDTRENAALNDLIALLKDFGERRTELGFGLRFHIKGLDESAK